MSFYGSVLDSLGILSVLDSWVGGQVCSIGGDSVSVVSTRIGVPGEIVLQPEMSRSKVLPEKSVSEVQLGTVRVQSPDAGSVWCKVSELQVRLLTLVSEVQK